MQTHSPRAVGRLQSLGSESWDPLESGGENPTVGEECFSRDVPAGVKEAHAVAILRVTTRSSKVEES